MQDKISTKGPQKGTMHAFPAASENVAVLNGGDGAGSIAVAGGDENRGGAGASYGNSTAVPRVSAWGSRADSPTEGGSRNAGLGFRV